MTFTLHVNIASDDLVQLKRGSSELCFARSVNGNYSTIWRRSKFFLNHNTLVCEDVFRIYAITKNDGRSYSNAVVVAPGECATLRPTGMMGEATGIASPGGPLIVDNQYNLVYIGVDARAAGKFSPMFISDSPCVVGKAEIMPTRKMLVWFETLNSLDPPHRMTRSKTIEVDFTNTSFISIRYASPANRPGDGQWSREDSSARVHRSSLL